MTIHPKHCKLTFWMPPALQFGQIKILIDVQPIACIFLMKFSMDFIEITPLPILMAVLDKQKGSTIASKATVSVPSEAVGRI